MLKPVVSGFFDE